MKAKSDFSFFWLMVAVTAATAVACTNTATADDAKSEHWAFRPVVDCAPPLVSDPAWSKSPVDRFVRAAMERHQLHPAPPADKRSLLRRATFDLTGLPPAPEELQAFLADDSPDAFARVVERLLTSPHYGERWGRHWLDLVRYADTAGETADFPAPHAWRYRNWVIDAINCDKPYDQFLTEQLAGDLLAAQLPADAPKERFAALVTATGFISVARRFGYDLEADHYLTIDDTLDVLGKSVLGLSISCARCHDHKYDPITTADYYGLYGIFESTRYPFPGCEKVKTSRDMVPLMPPAEFERIVRPFQQQLAELDLALRESLDEQGRLSKTIRDLAVSTLRLLADGQIENGGSQEISTVNKQLESVAMEIGQVIQLTILPRANDGADSTTVELDIAEVGGEGRRWNLVRDVVPDVTSGNPHADSYSHEAVWCFLDDRNKPGYLVQSVNNLENQRGLNGWRRGFVPFAIANSTDQPIKALSTVTFPPKSLTLHPSSAGGVGIAWLAPIDGTFTITGRVVDADHGGGDGVTWELELFTGDLAKPLMDLGRLAAAHEIARRKRDEFGSSAPKFDLAYAVAEGKSHDARIQRRGDPKSLGDEVPRRFLTVLGGQALSERDASGRLELARWLTDPKNPLTARVIVNRVWQHHFGQGLVKTPSDFGLRGIPPTHPELLDFLAARFVADGWSIKSLHRLLMLSQVYQQAATGNSHGAERDPDDTWLARYRRRRLSAEEIRDSMLAASGDLDRTAAGPHPFPEEKSWGFTQHAPFSAVYDHNRRSIYLMTQRIKRHPFLTTFDGADANASTADRYSTTVPTQALFFLNDPFVHARSASLAAKLMELPNDRARLDRAFELLFARPPGEDDHSAAARFLTDYQTELGQEPESGRRLLAWAAWLRVLMSGNEFIYVD